MARQQTDIDRQTGQTVEIDLVQSAARGEEWAIRKIVQSNNRRLYRIARSIVRDNLEAEDVLQEAYLKAFSALATFRQESSLATWLTRVVMNEALQHVRRRTDVPLSRLKTSAAQTAEVIPFPLSDQQTVDPERAMAQTELCRLIENAIDQLPEDFRTVLVARTMEGMSIEQTAELLGLRPETVKTRLHRARHLLKAALADHIEPLFSDVFPFAGTRCERMTDFVVRQFAATPREPS